MKPGDKFAVNLDQWTVAEAVVVDIEDGQVTLDIPATRIVMGVKTSLADLTPVEPSVEHQILGAEDGPQAPNTPDASSPTQQSTPVSAPPVPAPLPVSEVTAPVAETKPTQLPPDAIGDGLANVKLPEIE